MIFIIFSCPFFGMIMELSLDMYVFLPDDFDYLRLVQLLRLVPFLLNRQFVSQLRLQCEQYHPLQHFPLPLQTD